MNVLQNDYLKLKLSYENATKNEEWELVDKLEDTFLDAESNLVKWALDLVRSNGNNELANFWEVNWTKEVDKFINLALKL